MMKLIKSIIKALYQVWFLKPPKLKSLYKYTIEARKVRHFFSALLIELFHIKTLKLFFLRDAKYMQLTIKTQIKGKIRILITFIKNIIEYIKSPARIRTKMSDTYYQLMIKYKERPKITSEPIIESKNQLLYMPLRFIIYIAQAFEVLEETGLDRYVYDDFNIAQITGRIGISTSYEFDRFVHYVIGDLFLPLMTFIIKLHRIYIIRRRRKEVITQVLRNYSEFFFFIKNKVLNRSYYIQKYNTIKYIIMHTFFLLIGFRAFLALSTILLFYSAIRPNIMFYIYQYIDSLKLYHILQQGLMTMRTLLSKQPYAMYSLHFSFRYPARTISTIDAQKDEDITRYYNSFWRSDLSKTTNGLFHKQFPYKLRTFLYDPIEYRQNYYDKYHDIDPDDTADFLGRDLYRQSNDAIALYRGMTVHDKGIKVYPQMDRLNLGQQFNWPVSGVIPRPYEYPVSFYPVANKDITTSYIFILENVFIIFLSMICLFLIPILLIQVVFLFAFIFYKIYEYILQIKNHITSLIKKPLFFLFFDDMLFGTLFLRFRKNNNINKTQSSSMKKNIIKQFFLIFFKNNYVSFSTVHRTKAVYDSLLSIFKKQLKLFKKDDFKK